MSKCSQCRKMNKELATRSERFWNWVFKRFFSQEVQDLSQEKFTQGYSDGIAAGMKMSQDISRREFELHMSDSPYKRGFFEKIDG